MSQMTSANVNVHSKKPFPTTALLLGIFPFIIWVIYLLAFWPGVMSFDSIFQWGQAMKFSFTDWHPVFSTLMIWVATRIWMSPAAVVLFQLFFYSIVVSFTLVSFLEFGVPKWLLFLVSLAFALYLPNGMMAITIWKDIPYSICILGLTVVLLKIIVSRGGWLHQKTHLLILVGFCLGTSLYRHNGIPVALFTLIAILVFYREFWKPIVIASVFFIASFLLITGPIYQWLPVNSGQAQSIGVIFIHPIAAHVAAGEALTPGDQDYLNQIFPLSKGWDYSCYDATVLFYKHVNFAPVQQDPARIIRIFVKLTIAHPWVTINHFVCLSSFVWRIDHPEGVYLETVLQKNFDASTVPAFNEYVDTVQMKSQLPKVKEFLENSYSSMMNLDPHKILWRPAIYLYILLITVLGFCYVIHDFRYLLLLVPVIVQSVIIMFVAQLEAVRYQYPVYMIALLFVIPLLWSIFHIKNIGSSQNMQKPLREKVNTSI